MATATRPDPSEVAAGAHAAARSSRDRAVGSTGFAGHVEQLGVELHPGSGALGDDRCAAPG